MKTAKPSGSRPTKSADRAAAQHDRDCIAALLVARHDALDQAGGAHWGRKLVDHVPSLYARLKKTAKARAATKEKAAKKTAREVAKKAADKAAKAAATTARRDALRPPKP